jgi:hypothetical protein
VRLDTPILFGGRKIKAGVNLFGKISNEELKIKGMITNYLNLKVKPTLTLSDKSKIYEGETLKILKKIYKCIKDMENFLKNK